MTQQLKKKNTLMINVTDKSEVKVRKEKAISKENYTFYERKLKLQIGLKASHIRTNRINMQQLSYSLTHRRV